MFQCSCKFGAHQRHLSEMLAHLSKKKPSSADSPCHSQGKGKRSRRAGCVVVGREGVFVTAL